MLYEFYTESIEFDYTIPNYKKLLQFKGFMTFCYNFNLFPTPLSIDDIQLLYRSTSNGKEYYKNVPYAIY
jgi:hypothetical protein